MVPYVFNPFNESEASESIEEALPWANAGELPKSLNATVESESETESEGATRLASLIHI